MKKLKITLVALSILTTLNVVKSQSGLQGFWYKTLGAVRSTTWTAGAGWNIVEDDGRPFKKLFDAANAWSCPPYPTRAHIDGYYKSNWNFGLNFSYNNQKTGKIINGDVNSATNFFALDANAKYSFWGLYDINPLIGLAAKSMIDIYGTGGFGFTYRKQPRVNPCATKNLGFGVNVFVYKGWGIQLEAMSKFALTGPFFKTPANYLQYTFGVVYKFKPKPVALGKRYKYKRVKPKI